MGAELIREKMAHKQRLLVSFSHGPPSPRRRFPYHTLKYGFPEKKNVEKSAIEMKQVSTIGYASDSIVQKQLSDPIRYDCSESLLGSPADLFSGEFISEQCANRSFLLIYLCVGIFLLCLTL